MRRFLFLSLLALLALPCAAAGAQVAPLPTNPHGALRPGSDCSDCHTSSGWKGMRSDAKFDHSKDTNFPLTGRHEAATCTRCHLNLRFDEPKVAPTDCASCHVDVHRGNLAGECIRCHNTNDFRDVESVTLHQRTGFPLTGAHVTTPCEGCHKTERGGAYTAVAKDCVACHRQTLAQAAASGVDHSGFPTDCAQCHATLSWSGGANFDHIVVSGGFLLEGAHALQRCAACHTTPGFGLRFAPAPAGNNDCIACHRTDYDQQHGGSGFPTTCTDCHSINNWNSNFDHASAARGFSLDGAHAQQPCSGCHLQPGNALKFTPAPTSKTDCIACHRADYQAQHAADGYSTTCTGCHTVNNWTSNFNHENLFPINSGAHRGKWQTCATCHNVPGDPTQFTCFQCHEHNQTDMDADHRGRSGYSYDSQSCYRCHPRGRA